MTMMAVVFQIVGMAGELAAQQWRSSLYPQHWYPGMKDGAGRFLHDFSYAGYHRGDRPLPGIDDLELPVFDVTMQPFVADPTGGRDSTTAIQQAIDQAGNAGGGIVFLPAGTYRVRPVSQHSWAALFISRSGVILRGEGPDRTFIFNDSNEMRMKNVLRVAPRVFQQGNYQWRNQNGATELLLVRDAPTLSHHIMLDEVGDLAAGDWIIIRADPTDAFIEEHGMTGTWIPGPFPGVGFYRQITAVDHLLHRVQIDIPLRYPVLVRDRGRVFRASSHIDEIGIEDLAIGMVEAYSDSLGDDDWSVEGTSAYDIHASAAVEFNHVVNCWMSRVSSYRPVGNQRSHILSNGVRISFSRSITLDGVAMYQSQYHGEGGNGNHFAIQGSDSLLTRCSSTDARHNFSIGLIVATGNVLHDCESRDSRLPVDFHMHLSPANLVDSMVLEDDEISSERRTHADHGHGTTQSVLWNIVGLTTGWEVDLGLKVLVKTGQFGWGYVIGTSGPDHRVHRSLDPQSAPADFVEGENEGATLAPRSLYESMLAKRLAREKPRRMHGRMQP